MASSERDRLSAIVPRCAPAIDSVRSIFGGLDIGVRKCRHWRQPGFRGFDGTVNSDGVIEAITDEDWDRNDRHHLGAYSPPSALGACT